MENYQMSHRENFVTEMPIEGEPIENSFYLFNQFTLTPQLESNFSRFEPTDLLLNWAQNEQC